MTKLSAIVAIIILSAFRSQAQHVESFTTFFQKFSTVAAFQKSHIKFPLLYLTVDENEKQTKQLLTAKKWAFYNIGSLQKDRKNIFKVIKSANDQMIVNCQFEDTGIYINHIFKYVSGKWYLTQIVDSST